MPWMSDRFAKQNLLQALRHNPDLAGISGLPSLQTGQGFRLMRWLDESGLALSFLKSVASQDTGGCLPADWRNALESRRARNDGRLRDMLHEFRRLNDAFRSKGIMAITLKGFSLVPDFCKDPSVRHQTDFDFLIKPGDVDSAAEVLRTYGYSTPKLSYTGESFFSTPLHHAPSRTDDLYAIQRHRQVDLHVSLTESSPWLLMNFPGYDERAAIPMKVADISFCGLPLETRFLAQVLHAFRHSFRSWLRLSWLMEIGQCMDLHHANDALWIRLLDQTGNSLLMKRIFGFILTLTHRLFDSRIPCRIASWAADGMTPSLGVWLEHFSENWALADWPGSLSNLFVASDFIADPALRNEYLRSRLIPKRERLTIETPSGEVSERPLVWQIRRLKYVAHRAGVHFADLVRLPLEQWRWQRALGSARAGLDHGPS
jgi:hypothetical protein